MSDQFPQQGDERRFAPSENPEQQPATDPSFGQQSQQPEQGQSWSASSDASAGSWGQPAAQPEQPATPSYGECPLISLRSMRGA